MVRAELHSVAYILYVLYGALGRVIAQAKFAPRVNQLIGTTRTILVISWLFYPIAYLAPMVGIGGATGEVALQVGYSIADLTAKPLFGLFLYFIAREKTLTEEPAYAAQTTTS